MLGVIMVIDYSVMEYDIMKIKGLMGEGYMCIRC
jgi:hypothetical protein